MWMITASFWQLCHGSNGKTARRFLLPYSVIHFILSVIFVTSTIVTQRLEQINPQSLASQRSVTVGTLAFTLLVLLNDALFVRDFLFVLVSHADDPQLYRVCILYHWRFWPLVFPTALYLALARKSLLSSKNYITNLRHHSLQSGSGNLRV
jgi:hypothetical protein